MTALGKLFADNDHLWPMLRLGFTLSDTVAPTAARKKNQNRMHAAGLLSTSCTIGKLRVANFQKAFELGLVSCNTGVSQAGFQPFKLIQTQDLSGSNLLDYAAFNVTVGVKLSTPEMMTGESKDSAVTTSADAPATRGQIACCQNSFGCMLRAPQCHLWHPVAIGPLWRFYTLQGNGTLSGMITNALWRNSFLDDCERPVYLSNPSTLALLAIYFGRGKTLQRFACNYSCVEI